MNEQADGRMNRIDFIGTFANDKNLLAKIGRGRARMAGGIDPTMGQFQQALKDHGHWPARYMRARKRPSVYVVLSARHCKRTGDALRTFEEAGNIFGVSVSIYRRWYYQGIRIARVILRQLKTAEISADDMFAEKADA